MKITKGYLKRLIKEQIAAMEGDEGKTYMMGDEEVKVGDFLEILISDDGYERSIEKLENPETDYKNTRSYATSFKALVKIEQIAESEYSDY